MLKTQQNAWIHVGATVAVCAAGMFFGLSSADWCWIVLAIMAVWAAEALNTAFEFLADVASPEFHDRCQAVNCELVNASSGGRTF